LNLIVHVLAVSSPRGRPQGFGPESNDLANVTITIQCPVSPLLARRPNLRTVTPRTLQQTDMMMLHKVRRRLVEQRTSLINQLRGLLCEYGIVVAQGKANLAESREEATGTCVCS